MVLAERVATQRRHERDIDHARRDLHRRRPVRLAGPRRLALGGDDLGRPVRRPRPGGGDPDVVLPVDPGADGGRPVRAAERASAATSRSASTVVATVVSFVVAYVAVAWLLKFVAHHPITWFVTYRVALGVVLIVLLATGALSPT